VVGALPALVGVVLILIHLRRPLVSAEDQPIFTNSCLGLLCFTLAMWLFWGLELVAERICARFDERHNHLETSAEQHHSKQQRKLARLCKLIEDAEDRLTATENRLEEAVARLGRIEQQLDTVEQQGVALGAAFIDEGLPTDRYDNAS
jgi:DNA repair exonuclease SbcCD ATPase subunit